MRFRRQGRPSRKSEPDAVLYVHIPQSLRDEIDREADERGWTIRRVVIERLKAAEREASDE